LNLHKVCGQVLAGNEASIRLHLKLGFHQEGILRQQQRIGESYRDLVCFGILRQEWQAGHRKPPT
jgi:RimJ/RimL family protein N-acetyltransferase